MAQPVTAARKDSSSTTREECLVILTRGGQFHELSEKCKELLGAVSKTGILARRNSSVASTWNVNDGHNTRSSHTDAQFGAPHDQPKDSKSVGEIFLEGKSPEVQERIRQSIARTASRGGRVRSEELVTEQEVAREKAKIDLERRSSREKRQ